MAELNIEILTPARVMKKLTATQVQVPGILGCMGILPGHATLASELGTGELEVKGGEAGKDDHFFVSGGYIEVDDNSVKLLVDICERYDEIDKDRAASARKRAEDRLAGTEKIDSVRAQAALQRAAARLMLVAKKG